MLTVIDHGGFEKEKKELDHLGAAFKDNIILELSNNGHIIQVNHLSFELNFRDADYQRMLSPTSHTLLKAIEHKNGTLLDACGGLGKDGFLLAHRGLNVTSCESNPIIYSILSQAIERYTKNTPIDWKCKRGKCQQKMNQPFDIVYLDPMFNIERNAKPQKSMQIIQSINIDEPNFTDWDIAWHCAQKRLVIKQHRSSPIIDTLPKPTLQIKGKRNTRFDIYIKPNQ